MAVITRRVESVEGRQVRLVDLPGVVQALTGITVREDDLALVLVEGGQMWVIGTLDVAIAEAPPSGPDAPVKPKPPSSRPRKQSFRPSSSGSYRSGSWRGDTSDLYQGDYTGRGIQVGGCWWGKLPSWAKAGTIKLTRRSGAGSGSSQTPTMTLLAGTKRPGGAPSVRHTKQGPGLRPGETETWRLPSEWVSDMADGQAGGIGITSGGSRNPYLGLVVSGSGMTLTLTS